jgi:hypothetical protein
MCCTVLVLRLRVDIYWYFFFCLLLPHVYKLQREGCGIREPQYLIGRKLLCVFIGFYQIMEDYDWTNHTPNPCVSATTVELTLVFFGAERAKNNNQIRHNSLIHSRRQHPSYKIVAPTFFHFRRVLM